MINTAEDIKFHNFVQLSKTRWLARCNVIEVILQQWLELKSYFSLIINSEKSYMARVLYMLNDSTNNIYLTIVYSILLNVNNVNCLFQRDNADIVKIYGELYMLLLSCLRIIIKPIFWTN